MPFTQKMYTFAIPKKQNKYLIYALGQKWVRLQSDKRGKHYTPYIFVP